MGWTSDSYTYVSTSWQPKSVTLVDTRSGQEFWTVEVPVGKKLVVSFAEKEGTSDGFTPDGMKWAIIDPTEDFPRLGNQLPVPPKDVRRLDVTIRPTPELPEGMTPRRASAGGSGN